MPDEPQFSATRQGQECVLRLGGRWSMQGSQPDATPVLHGMTEPGVRSVRLLADDLGPWDSSLLVFLVRVIRHAQEHALTVDQDGLPDGLRRLLQLAFAVPSREGAQRATRQESFLELVGDKTMAMPQKVRAVLEFLGEIAFSAGRMFRGKADMRPQDILVAMQECGAEALPIISLTSMLFGLILAFVGAVQLMQFGAQMYVAGLVGIGMLRVMGAVMVGVVMSGRMGASYAALIGTMQVNEEVDALSTLGISPVDFLVMPRIVALTLMTPLLTLYADLMGVMGGFLVAVSMLGLHPLEYYNATIQLVPFKHVIIGLVYGTVFGVIVAVAGCYQGVRCGRSAAAVGQATTAAVVTAIVGIIVATAIITVICDILKV